MATKLIQTLTPSLTCHRFQKAQLNMDLDGDDTGEAAGAADADTTLGVFTVCRRLVVGSVAKKALPCALSSRARAALRRAAVAVAMASDATASPEMVELVVIKDRDIELMEYDTANRSWMTVFSQPVFGQVYDAEVLRVVRQVVPAESAGMDGVENRRDVVVVLSDSGLVSLLEVVEETKETHGHAEALGPGSAMLSDARPLRFRSILQVEPTLLASAFEMPARFLAVEPRDRAVAVCSAMDGIRVFFVQNIDPILTVENSIIVQADGTVLGAWFLSTDENDNAMTLIIFAAFDGILCLYAYKLDASTPMYPNPVASLNLDECSNFFGKAAALVHRANAVLFASDTDLYCVCLREVDDGYTLAVEFKMPVSWDQSRTSSKQTGAAALVSSLSVARTQMPMRGGRSDIVFATSDSGCVVRHSVNTDAWNVSTVFCGKREPIANSVVVWSSLYQDYLLIMGDMSDSEVVVMDYRNQAVRHELSIESWVPVTDFASCDPEKIGVPSTYLISGWTPSSRMLRMQRGVRLSADSDSVAGFEWTSGLWPLSANHGDHAFVGIAVSFLRATRVLKMEADQVEDVSDALGISMNVPSLHVAVLGDAGLLAQVQPGAVEIGQSPLAVAADAASNTAWSRWVAVPTARILMGSSLADRVCVLLDDSRVVLLQARFSERHSAYTLEVLATMSMSESVSSLQCFNFAG
ncbi:hypothetical protein HK405_015159, partial [Cladochytrium tenue]